MQSDDLSYYRRRAQQERERAAACPDSSVAMAHLKMAEAYEKRLSGASLAGVTGANVQLEKRSF